MSTIHQSFYQKDIHEYLRMLERVVMSLLKEYSIDSHLIPGLTGVWAKDPCSQRDFKLAAIGVKIRRWITMHGVSINVNPDMKYFRNIIPCGITDKEVGTLSQFLEKTKYPEPLLVTDVAKKLVPILEHELQVECRLCSKHSSLSDEPEFIRRILL